jgi:hypothetical protein
MAYTLSRTGKTTLTFAELQSEETNKEAQLNIITMPAADSNATLIFDFMGVQRDITIEGIYVGSVANQISFISNLEAYCDGEQTKSTYASETLGTKYVFVTKTRIRRDPGVLTAIRFQVTMTEGSG